ncbi:hypothetical protein JHK82_022637 [Glycine max]|nr:hypothetical protein JHK86_022660 [Glycine max]KAG5137906.1 hypothetical protein JHK82_022637 [Glycine max]
MVSEEQSHVAEEVEEVFAEKRVNIVLWRIRILHTPNYHHRALDSAILSHLPSILLRAKEYNDDDIDNDHSVSLLQHSLPSFKEISFNKPTLPRASSFAITRNKASRTRHCFYQKQLRRVA